MNGSPFTYSQHRLAVNDGGVERHCQCHVKALGFLISQYAWFRLRSPRNSLHQESHHDRAKHREHLPVGSPGASGWGRSASPGAAEGYIYLHQGIPEFQRRLDRRLRQLLFGMLRGPLHSDGQGVLGDIRVSVHKRPDRRKRAQLRSIHNQQTMTSRHTFVVLNRHALRSRREEAAHTGAHGRIMLTIEQLAARLAGGFLQSIPRDKLQEAVRKALHGGAD